MKPWKDGIFYMENTIYNDLHNVKLMYDQLSEVAKSACYDASHIGKIIHKHADSADAAVVLLVLTVTKTAKGESESKADIEYTVRYIEIRVPCATPAEAVVAYAGLTFDTYVVFNDERELVAVLSGSLDE